MDFPLVENGLSENELDYELNIRKALPSGTKRQKGIELNRLMKLENTPPKGYIEDDKDFTRSIELLTELQKKLKEAILKQDEEIIEQTSQEFGITSIGLSVV